MSFVHDWHFWALSVFYCLNAIDVVFTRIVILSGGKEFNPAVRFLVRRFGYKGMVGFKFLVLTLFTFQYFAHKLDLYTICYFDFYYSVMLTMMYFDIKSVGLKPFSFTVCRIEETEG